MSGMTAVCRDFAAGMCRRGNECRYVHEGGGWRQIDRHHNGGLTTDGRGNRLERERQLVYESKESLTDTQEKNNYSREKLSWWHEEHREYGLSNNGQHQGYRSNERCFDFTKGRCFRGEACRYIHHDASFDGGWSVRDESRDRFHDISGVGSASCNRRPEHQRFNDLPCKYYLRGHCIHGEGCKFYHQVEPLNIPVQRSLDGSHHSFVSGGSAENLQRRIPKWDLVAELHDENVGHDSALPGKVDDNCTDLTEARLYIQSANQSGEERNNKIIHSDDICEKSQYSEQFDLEGCCKYGFKRQDWEPSSQDRTMAEYVENQDKSHKVACDMSPCHEESYHRTCNMSPVDERSRPHRMACRKRSRSRSLSYDSRSRSWSRSKSPSCGRMSGMTPLCRAFAAGMCRRGNECSYLHEGSGWRQVDSHHDAGFTDGRGSRRILYETKLYLTDTQEQNNYSPEEQREDGWPSNGQHPGYRSIERCFDFTKGRCFRGEACRYIHHASSFDGGWSVRDESRERFYDRRGAGSGSFNRRQEHQRLSDVPCKYFLKGHCNHGEGCRFYHQVEPLNIPVQRSLDGSQHSFVSGGSAGNFT